MRPIRFRHGCAILAAFGVLAILAAGCDDDSSSPCSDFDPPAAPRGVTSITGDEEVTILWYPNEEPDLDRYRVYRGDHPTGSYVQIASVPASSVEYVDQDVTNGETYYYAVSALDWDGNESDLSPELVQDTPRPEGRGLRLRNYNDDPSRSAYDFSHEMVTGYDDPRADIAYLYDPDGGAWILGLEDPDDPSLLTELQDAGFAEFDDVTWAPPDGWSPRAEVEVIEGHVYVAWTRDDHYAKFRVVRVTPQEVVLDWAYQIDPGNQELREASPALASWRPPRSKAAASGAAPR
ncbi:MAG: fibronectin type III domain-containing protein [Candidatus Eisenbacteria bacterium]|nr:fibronectin type III domain-containing protein [Candidatus Eisenbacteria bacterium]